MNELSLSIDEGYEAYVVFIVQMKNVKYFIPNVKTHKAFAEALKKSSQKGVKIMALDCDVEEDSITARDFVSIKFDFD